MSREKSNIHLEDERGKKSWNFLRSFEMGMTVST